MEAGTSQDVNAKGPGGMNETEQLNVVRINERVMR